MQGCPKQWFIVYPPILLIGWFIRQLSGLALWSVIDFELQASWGKLNLTFNLNLGCGIANSNCKSDIAMGILFNIGFFFIAFWVLSTIIGHLIHISQNHTLLELEVLQMLEGKEYLANLVSFIATTILTLLWGIVCIIARVQDFESDRFVFYL